MEARLEDIYLSTEFLADSDPYKYARRWSSGFHRQIKRIMFAVSPRVMLTRFPYNFYFVRSFMAQFFESMELVQTKKDLLSRKVRVLYRGMMGIGTEVAAFEDKGFVSFTGRKHVAEKFAGNGVVLALKTRQLGADFTAILVDETVDRQFHEQEYVFLPGRFEVSNTSDSGSAGTTLVKYMPNERLIQDYMDIPLPDIRKISVQSGGSVGTGMETSSSVPDEDMCGKFVVFYRSIQGRRPDVLQSFRLSRDQVKVDYEVRFTCRRKAEWFEEMSQIIPEYTELLKLAHDPKVPKARREKAVTRFLSYAVHMGLYDPDAHRVMTLNVECHPQLFAEMHPNIQDRAEDIKKVILEYFAKRT